ncbi:nuclease-related domain-containing protein [Bacillus thuringiensis]|uniref:nuclease-related domain-containing protein n=1 Tax=Bacillus thuringiensis TaxID=1428 RepID=UPI0033386396
MKILKLMGMYGDPYKVLGSQVSVRTSKGIRRIDHLVRTPRGKLLAVEVKSGNARRSKMELAKDKLIRTKGGRIIGKNAPEKLKGKVHKIRTVVVTPK